MTSLAQGWVEAKLRDVCLVFESRDPGWNPELEFTYVDIGAIDNKTQSISSPKRLLGADAPSRARRVIKANDILFSTVRTYLKNIAMVPQGLDGAYTSTGIVVLRAGDAIEPRYLFNWVTSDEFITEISKSQDGTLYPAVTDKDVFEAGIRLAPIPEQRRIVAKVDGLTARTARARKELDRIPTLIARYKQRLLALSFTGDGFDIRTTLGGITEQVTKGESPKWQGFEYQDDGILFLRSQNVGWGKLLLEEQVFLDPSFNLKREKSTIQPGDVLLNIVGASIGRTAVATEKIMGANCNQAVAIIRLKDRDVNDQKYVCWWLQSPEAQGLIVEGAVDVARANFSLANIRAMNLPWPSKSQRSEIVRRIESAFGWLDRVAADHAAVARLLPKLDASILAKAFGGELVPQNPNDEPASVLLQRINDQQDKLSRKPKTVSKRRSGSKGQGTDAVLPPNVVLASARKRKVAMAKSRQDDEVMGKPYLAGLLEVTRSGDVKKLFAAAELPVADFYKQLAWEIDQGYIIDDIAELKAA